MSGPVNVYTEGTGTASIQRTLILAAPPPSTLVNYPVGQLADVPSLDQAYMLTSKHSSSGVVVATWSLLSPGTGGGINTINSAFPLGGNFNIEGTANQITVTTPGSTANSSAISLTGPYAPATYTAHGVLIGEGTSPIVATNPGTDGQVLTGNTGADPTFEAIGTKSGLTANGVVISQGAGAFTATSSGNAGEVLTSNGPGLDPTFQPASSPAFTFSSIAVPTLATANTGWFADAPLTLTLPATGGLIDGNEVIIICKNAGPIVVQANAGQVIEVAATTSAVGGTATNTAVGDSLTLYFQVSSASWTASASMGAWNVV